MKLKEIPQQRASGPEIPVSPEFLAAQEDAQATNQPETPSTDSVSPNLDPEVVKREAEAREAEKKAIILAMIKEGAKLRDFDPEQLGWLSTNGLATGMMCREQEAERIAAGRPMPDAFEYTQSHRKFDKGVRRVIRLTIG